jgi:TonB family protein
MPSIGHLGCGQDSIGSKTALVKTSVFVVGTKVALCLPFVAFAAQPSYAAATHKTDAELAKELIGTWELTRHRRGFSKRFLIFNADGTSKAIRLTNDRGSPRRAENEGTWRVSNGYIIREIAKTSHDPNTASNVRAQVDSIGNGIVKLRGDEGSRDEMRRIAHLPSLPPLLESAATWAPELSAAERAEYKKAIVSNPQPVYPTIARQKRIQGRGMFRLNVAKDGRVDSIQIVKSTGSKILDDSAEKALRQWRFKPGAMTGKINVPIDFVLSRR